ncbi:predicted protein, partial [Nematostella vectensis]
DLGFLIDASGSVEMYGTGTFKKCINFVKRVLRAFDVSEKGTHVGAIIYSTDTKLAFDFNTYKERGDIEAAFDRVKFLGETTFTGKGLKMALSELYKTARKDVSNLLVVITDGRSHDDVVKPSEMLRNAGVRIVTVGLGNSFDINQLKAMAGKPYNKNVITVDFPQLDYAAGTLQDALCKGTDDTLE